MYLHDFTHAKSHFYIYIKVIKIYIGTKHFFLFAFKIKIHQPTVLPKEN